MPDHGLHLLELQTNQSRGISVGSETIHAAAFSPDGKMLAGADSKNRVSLWDAASLKELRCLRGHEGEVRALDFSPDGKRLITGGVDKTVRLWDAAAGKELRRIQAPGLVDGVRYSPDGKVIAARSDGRAILLWDAQSGKLLCRFADCYGGGFSYPIAFSPDGKRLLGAQGNALQVWETATGKELFPASAIREGIVRVAYSGSGRTLATVSQEGTVRLWDTATYRELRRFGGRQPIIHGLAFSADGRLVAAAGQDQTTRLWDAATGKELFRWETDINGGFDSAFTPDGQVLASCNGNASIQLWLTTTGKPLHRLQGHSNGPVYCIAFSPDGTILVSGGLDKTLRFWDWNSGRELRVLKGHTDWVMAVDFAPDGQTLASAAGSGDKFIRLWDVKTGKELRRFGAQEPGLNTAIHSLAFSPDGRTIASAGFGGAIHLWEVATGKERCCFRGHDYRIANVAFSPDGRLLASTGDDGTVLFWDATGRHLDGLPSRQRLTRQLWETCWRDLADPDAHRAYRALQALATDPERSLARLQELVQAVPAADAQQTARLIRDLDSEDFAVRTKAGRELVKQGESVRSALEQTLKEMPSPEVRRRIGQLLEQLELEHSPSQLRLLRAVEAVEQMRTPEARRLLQLWSKGAPTARLTREAKESLRRLDSRNPVGR
jgi:WD40 repeat protein